MPSQSLSGHPVHYSASPTALGAIRDAEASVWRRWASLRSDILRRLYACDREAEPLTIDQLADSLDEALGLVERRVAELQRLGMVRCVEGPRITLEFGSQRRCG